MVSTSILTALGALFSTTVAICSWNITCPCGISNTTMSFCLDEAPRPDEPCDTWANCATCQIDSNECLSCPEERYGETCDQRISSEILCDPLIVPENLQLKPPCGLKNGSACQVQCEDAVDIMVGDPNFICQAPDWKGVMPTCENDWEYEEGEYNDEEYDRVTCCMSPGPIDNGHFTVLFSFNNGGSPPSVDDDEFPERTRIKFFCDDGYSMSGGFPTMYCQHNGFWSRETPLCNMECGYSAVHSLRKLFRGINTLPGEWPWTVAISKISGRFSRLSCGASLLDNRTVLTAAHCLMDPDLENTTDVRLYFGKYNRSDARDDDQVVTRTPNIFIIHPKYDAETKDNDIALIRFEPPIRYGKRIRPVCLPTKETSEINLNIGQSGYVVGWGTTEMHLESDQLCMALVPVLPGPECMLSFQRQNISMLITRNMFCAGFPEGKVASCTVDSGGPLVFHDPETDRHTIEGIVSFGRHRECGMEHRYTVYTKVSRYLRWIKESMAMSGQDELSTYCERPSPLDNGQWSVVFEGGRTDSQNSAEEEYPEDTRLEFTCRDGFSIVGTPTLRCLSNGKWSGDTPVCQVECGYSTQKGQHPWMVQLSISWSYRGVNISSICRAVLINDTTVVSVAHCLINPRAGYADAVRLYFGEHDDVVRTRTVRTIKGYDQRPNPSATTGITVKMFNFYNVKNDIALVRFAPPIEFSRGIRPVCLPTRRTSKQNLQPGKSGYALDWGLNGLNLHVVSAADCFASIEKRNVSDLVANDNLFCAGYKTRENDRWNSGRPLVFYDATTEKYTLEGVGSTGLSSRYYVFTKVSAYLDWIKVT